MTLSFVRDYIHIYCSSFKTRECLSFNIDGTLRKNINYNSCSKTSIQQLYKEGRAFNFVNNPKQTQQLQKLEEKTQKQESKIQESEKKAQKLEEENNLLKEQIEKTTQESNTKFELLENTIKQLQETVQVLEQHKEKQESIEKCQGNRIKLLLHDRNYLI